MTATCRTTRWWLLPGRATTTSLFIHLLYLVEFENRLLVLIQWAINYVTWNRGARLITGPSPLPLK